MQTRVPTAIGMGGGWLDQGACAIGSDCIDTIIRPNQHPLTAREGLPIGHRDRSSR